MQAIRCFMLNPLPYSGHLFIVFDQNDQPYKAETNQKPVGNSFYPTRKQCQMLSII